MGADTGASFDKLGVPIKYENWQLRENIAIGPQAPGFCSNYFWFNSSFRRMRVLSLKMRSQSWLMTIPARS